MKVEHEAPVIPPEDFAMFDAQIAAMDAPAPVWHRFSTELAHADVAVLTPGVFLLNWIESFAPGNGTALLEAVGEWADENAMTGRLVCPPGLAGWYRDRGRWKRTGALFNGQCVMERVPAPSHPKGVSS